MTQMIILLPGVHQIPAPTMRRPTNPQRLQDPSHMDHAGGHSLVLVRGLMDNKILCLLQKEKARTTVWEP